MKTGFSSLHFPFKLSSWVLCISSSGPGGRPWGQSRLSFELKLSPQAIRTAQPTRSARMDNAQTMIHRFDLHCPPAWTHPLCPMFFLFKPGRIFSTLETISERLVRRLPGVILTETNPFLALHPHPTPLSTFGFCLRRKTHLICLGPPEPGPPASWHQALRMFFCVRRGG